MGRKRKQIDTSITSSSEDCQLQAAVPSRIARSELDAMSTAASIGIDTTHSSLSLADSSPTSGLDGSLLSAATDQDGCSGSEHQLPVLRNAANERERARMRVLSRAFTRLKTSLPWVPADTKLSKLDTLRLASCYIAHLSRLLAEDDAASCAGGATVTSSVATGATPTVAADTTTATTNDHVVKVKDEKTVSKELGSVTSGKTATSARTASGGGVVSASTTANIHPLSLTWPFSFSSRNGSTIANQCHRSLAQSPLTQVLPSCDVRTITSPTAPVVTSSNGGGKVSKVRGHHGRPQPQALASSV